MANYKEQTLAGTSWVRCNIMSVSNPLPNTGPKIPGTNEYIGPIARFLEEKVINIDGIPTVISPESTTCEKRFSPTATITLLNPETNLPTGQTMTHGELYGILYSLYIQTALERDAALAAQ